ncbi:MerR family DNA-binding transcriptional regulator [Patescibacteria group bacterium]
MDKKFPISQAAKILGTHPNTLRNWESKNILVPQRDNNSNYRYYLQEQLNAFLERGKSQKIEIKWGYEYSKCARKDEVFLVKKSLDVIVSSEASTSPLDKQFDNKLIKQWRLNIANKVKARFIRNLDNPRMKEIAQQLKKLGIKTNHRKVAGFTMSIRDIKVVRIEVPSDNPEQRLNLLIHDSKVAKSFTVLFEKLWKT